MLLNAAAAAAELLFVGKFNPLKLLRPFKPLKAPKGNGMFEGGNIADEERELLLCE